MESVFGSALSSFEENIRKNKLHHSASDSMMYIAEVAASPRKWKRKFESRTSSLRKPNTIVTSSALYKDPPIVPDQTDIALHIQQLPLDSVQEDGIQRLPRNPTAWKARRRKSVGSEYMKKCSRTENSQSSIQSTQTSNGGSLSNLKPGEVYPHTRFYSPLIPKKPSVSYETDSPTSIQKRDVRLANGCLSPGTHSSDNLTISTSSLTSASACSTEKHSSAYPNLSQTQQLKHNKLIRHLEARNLRSPRTKRNFIRSPSLSSISTPTSNSSLLFVSPVSRHDFHMSEPSGLSVESDPKPIRKARGRRVTSPTAPKHHGVCRITPYDLTLKRAQIQAKSMQLRRGLDSLVADVNAFSAKPKRRRMRPSTDRVDNKILDIEGRIKHRSLSCPRHLGQQSMLRMPIEPPFAHEDDKETIAATRIQALVRGSICASRFKIRRLNRVLMELKQRKRKDLMLVELQTIKRKELIKHKLVERSRKKEQQIQELLDSRNKIVKYLENENRKIAQQNQKLAETSLRLRLTNKQTAQSTSVFNDNFQTLWKTIEALSKQEEKLQTKAQRYKKRMDKQMANMAATRARSMTETKIRKALEKGLMDTVELFEERCDDGDLVQLIVSIGDGDYESEEPDGQSEADDDEAEGGFLLTWCIDDEASINSDITSVHDPEEMFETIDEGDFIEEEVAESVCDDCSCQSSVWVETHSILM